MNLISPVHNKQKQLSPNMQRIVNWYLLFTILFSLLCLTSGIWGGIGMFIVLWGLFGIIAPIFKTKTLKSLRITYIVMGLLLVVIGGAMLPDVQKSQAAPKKDITLAASAQTIDKTAVPKVSPVPENGPKLYKVTGITDGDTIKVNINGKTETVRFIGDDTPETKDPKKPVQCFGKEASSQMQHFVQSKYVVLEADSTQGDRDKYNRLLRYVFLEDGTNIGLEMIKGGYAHEYTYNKPYKYKAEFLNAQTAAKTASAGFWSPATCGGDTNKAANAPKTVTPAPTPPAAAAPVPRPVARPVPVPAPAPALTPAPAGEPYYANCTEVKAAGKAPIYPGQPGFRTTFDRDNDGIGCE